MTAHPLNLRLTKRLLAYSAVAGTVAAGAARASAHSGPPKLNGDFYLDLNRDGIFDFHIQGYVFSGFGDLNVYPTFPGNKIVAAPIGCQSHAGNTADILGYAYETAPNKLIIAGDEGKASNASALGTSLGELAAVRRSLSLRREENNQ